MSDAPFAEKLVAADTKEPAAIAARGFAQVALKTVSDLCSLNATCADYPTRTRYAPSFDTEMRRRLPDGQWIGFDKTASTSA